MSEINENLNLEVTDPVTQNLDLEAEEAQDVPAIILNLDMQDGASVKSAEAWAVGQRGGVDVPSTDVTYHNNAKYYSEETAAAIDDIVVVQDATPTAQKTKVWMPATAPSGVQVPTYAEHQAVEATLAKVTPTNTGTQGQILRNNGQGGAVWTDAATAEEVATAAEAWLNDHVSQGETLAIDNTLTLSGYAGDAKVTGDKISELKSAFEAVEKTIGQTKTSSDYTWTLKKNISATGEESTVNGFALTGYISIGAGFCVVNTAGDKGYNDKNTSFLVNQYNGSTWLSRTQIKDGQAIKLDDNCTQIRIGYGYPSAESVTITQAMVDTYFSMSILQEFETKSAFEETNYSIETDLTSFGQGKWAVSNGDYSVDSKVIRTYKFTPTTYNKAAVGVMVSDTFEFSVLCWKKSDDTYMGSWTGSGFSKSSNTFFRRTVYFREIGNEYKICLNVRNRTTSTEITPADGTNIKFINSTIAQRVPINQGVGNAGKVLEINNKGNVVPGIELISYLPHEEKIADKSGLGSGKYIDTSTGSNWTNGFVTNSGSIYTESAIDVSNFIGETLIIEIGSSDSHTGIRELGFCNTSNIVSSVTTEGGLSFSSEGGYLRARVRITNTHLFFSCSSKSRLVLYVETKGTLIKDATTDVIYVATDGDDSNNGTSAMPYATVNKAIREGAKTVCIKGGTYKQRISFTDARHGTINIINATPTKKVVFMSPDCVISESETAVEGYSRVYSLTTSKSFNENNIYIYQDGIPDAMTEITSEKRMPEQRGQVYRCYDTRIVLCVSETLADALNEIENDTTYYRWFKDGTTIYFSRPAEVSTSNPICGSFNTALFSGLSRINTINMSGIDVKYMRVNIENTSNSRIVDCSASYVFGEGAFTFDGSVEIEFVRCEAARAHSGQNGDGFNAHSSNTNDAFAHQTTATLIDCWSHDNRDDGISTHERSETTIIGGLFEWNARGGGVTPANGAHYSCYNVYSRDNGDGGFLYMNPTSEAEGGVGGQILCIDCVSDSNNIYSGASIKGGFKVNSAGNKAILIGCKALNEEKAYYVADNDGSMILIDCGVFNCTTAKSGKTANILVQNTTIVE